MGWLKTRNDNRERVGIPPAFFTGAEDYELLEEHTKGIKYIYWSAKDSDLKLTKLELPTLIATYPQSTSSSINSFTTDVQHFFGCNNLQTTKFKSLSILGNQTFSQFVSYKTLRNVKHIYYYSLCSGYIGGYKKTNDILNLPNIECIENTGMKGKYDGGGSANIFPEWGILFGPNLTYIGNEGVWLPFPSIPNNVWTITFLGVIPPTCGGSAFIRFTPSGGTGRIYVRKEALTTAYGGTNDGTDPTTAYDLAPNLSGFKTYMLPFTYACITYDDDHVTCMGRTIHSITGEPFVTPVAPVKSGYVFDGWYNEADDTLYDFDIVPTGDINLYARWEEA